MDFTKIAEVQFPGTAADSTARQILYTKNQMDRLGKTLRIAVTRAVITANDVISGAYIPSGREEALEDMSTNPEKIRSPEAPVMEDPTKLIDHVTYKEILGEGGSRGILLVAEGLVDAAVELVKGFRPLDRVPGCYIAQGANAEVVDIDNIPLSFGADSEFEDTITDLLMNFINELFDNLRQKFIVAATRNLAEEPCLRAGRIMIAGRYT